MSMTHPDARRAAALRARIVAIAQACAEEDLPLPRRDMLALLTGATRRQIDRHIPALRDTGALATERRGRWLYVQEARP